MIAVMEPLVQRRTGSESPENQHQHKGKPRRHCYCSPAKTQTDLLSP